MIQTDRNPDYFLTVARERSISRAAEKLFISQPYLSQYIIRLEKAFRVRLIDRDKTPLSLTPAGEIYMTYLETSQNLHQKLLRDFQRIKDRETQTLRLGFSSWRAGTLLPDILPAFSELYPFVRPEFVEVPTSDLYRIVADDKVDLAIMNTTLDVPGDFTMETLLYERILLVGHKDSPVTRKLLAMKDAGEALDLRLLEQERVIMLRPEMLMAKRINNFLDKQQVVLRNCIYTTSAQTALNLTAENYGLCFLNETGIYSAPRNEELAFFPFDSEDMSHPLCAVYKKDSYLTPAARNFIDLSIRFYKEKSGLMRQTEDTV